MGLSVRPEELAHLHLPFKRQRKWTKYLWPSEALVLTQVTSVSQRKGTVTASPRGTGGTMCVEQRNKVNYVFPAVRHWVELQGKS